jgi:hypothetical protein
LGYCGVIFGADLLRCVGHAFVEGVADEVVEVGRAVWMRLAILCDWVGDDLCHVGLTQAWGLSWWERWSGVGVAAIIDEYVG